MRIATFNVQNLRLREKNGEARLDGAWDHDDPQEDDPRLDRLDRTLTAEVLRSIDADVIALQEVFDRKTLDHFHDQFLAGPDCPPYPYRACLPGNDGRGLNVALLSRIKPLRVDSHAHETNQTLDLPDAPADMDGRRIFRRDCLEVALPRLTLFLCHFKAPYPDAMRARDIRRLEAAAVRKIIETRFDAPAGAMWLVLGDMNEPQIGQPGSALGPLTDGFSVDLMDRVGDDWTYIEPDKNTHARPDGLLASPKLANRFPDARPAIQRAGMTPDTPTARYRTFDTVGTPRPHASDHAAVYIDFPGL